MSDIENKEEGSTTSSEETKKSEETNSQESNSNTGNSEKNGSEDKKTSSADSKTAKSDSFSADYVKKLREEAKSHRTKASDLESKLEEAQKQIETLGKTSLDKANKISTAIEKRLINAEISKIARDEGIIDIDAFKMVDLSKVTLSDDGEVVGLAPIVDELKSKKPYLFNKASSSNKDAKAPASSSSNAEKPTYETNADFEKAKTALLAQFR